MEEGQPILERRELNRKLLVHHSTLLDLLEIPQLMDTYVWKTLLALFQFAVVL